MNELTLDGKIYVSSRRAAEITGYAKDYVGQLCREGHVEARLVGRNWYVLESSIKAHRFGAAEEATSADPETEPWRGAKYASEEPVPLPVFPGASPVNLEIPISPVEESMPQPAAILTDMESAWKEWFSQKEEAQPETEVTAEEVPMEEYPVVEETTEEAVEVPVQLHVAPDEEVLDLSHRSHAAVAAPYNQEGYVIEEKIITNTRGVALPSNLVLRSLFVAVALIAATISLIGTGYAQKIVGSNLYRLSEINFIAGVSEINKQAK